MRIAAKSGQIFVNQQTLDQWNPVPTTAPPASQACNGQPCPVQVIRMYLHDTPQRIWTVKQADIDSLISQGWVNEGNAFHAFASNVSGTVPVEQLSSNGVRFLTIQPAEVDLLKNRGWTDEGIAFYAYPPQGAPNGSKPVFRMYQRDQQIRFWTQDQPEADYLKDRGWIVEGADFYVPQ